MLAIFCHIVQGEAVIKEKQGTTKPATGKAAGTSGEAAPGTSSVVASRAVTPPRPEVNDLNVQQVCFLVSLDH
jgi:hypothetical protein